MKYMVVLIAVLLSNTVLFSQQIPKKKKIKGTKQTMMKKQKIKVVMDNRVRVLMAYEVPCLDEVLENKDSIRQELNSYINSILANVNTQDLDDWKLLINITLMSTNGIGVYKRIGRFSSEKEFEISISIPIPNDRHTSYGTSKVDEAFYTVLNDKFYTLEPHYEKYETLHQYIYESSKLAIDLAFTHGFTCNGKKIKFQN